jgi:replicative DNA helicase
MVQLNRALEARADKRPMISDLRESGAIEQEADIILLAYRPEYYKMTSFPETGYDARGKVEIIGGKVRNSSTGSAFLDFQGQFTKMVEPSVPPSILTENGFYDAPHMMMGFGDD